MLIPLKRNAYVIGTRNYAGIGCNPLAICLPRFLSDFLILLGDGYNFNIYNKLR